MERFLCDTQNRKVDKMINESFEKHLQENLRYILYSKKVKVFLKYNSRLLFLQLGINKKRQNRQI